MVEPVVELPCFALGNRETETRRNARVSKQHLSSAATQVGLLVYINNLIYVGNRSNRTLCTRYDPPRGASSCAKRSTLETPPVACVCTIEAGLRGKKILNLSRDSDECMHVVAVEVGEMPAMYPLI